MEYGYVPMWHVVLNSPAMNAAPLTHASLGTLCIRFVDPSAKMITAVDDDAEDGTEDGTKDDADPEKKKETE